MMRLSPRLICFIGASSALLRSALAAQDDAIVTKSKAFEDLATKIKDDVTEAGTMGTLHYQTGHYFMMIGGDKAGQGVLLRVFENGLRTISSAEDSEHMCNIIDIEQYEKEIPSEGRIQQQLIVTGTKCRKTYGKNARGEHHMYYTFEEFHHTMTFNIKSIEDVEKLKTHFVTACTFGIGKFPVVEAKKKLRSLPYSRSGEKGGYKLRATPGFAAKAGLGLATVFKKTFTLGYSDKVEQEVFKRTEMMLCRDQQGKPVAAWNMDKTSCQWMELEGSFNILTYLDDKQNVMAHPLSGDVLKQYPDKGFEEMIWTTEIAIKGQTQAVKLGDAATSLKQKKYGFLHFVLQSVEGEQNAEEAEEFIKYFRTSGIFEANKYDIMRDDGVSGPQADKPQGPPDFMKSKHFKEKVRSLSQYVRDCDAAVKALEADEEKAEADEKKAEADEKKKINFLAQIEGGKVRKTLKHVAAPIASSKPKTLNDEILERAKKRGKFQLDLKEKKYDDNVCDDLKAKLEKQRKKMEEKTQRLDKAERR